MSPKIKQGLLLLGSLALLAGAVFAIVTLAGGGDRHRAVETRLERSWSEYIDVTYVGNPTKDDGTVNTETLLVVYIIKRSFPGQTDPEWVAFYAEMQDALRDAIEDELYLDIIMYRAIEDVATPYAWFRFNAQAFKGGGTMEDTNTLYFPLGGPAMQPGDKYSDWMDQ